MTRAWPSSSAQMPSLEQGGTSWRRAREQVRRTIKLHCPRAHAAAPLASHPPPLQHPHQVRPRLPPHRCIRPQRACHVLRAERARHRLRSPLQLPHHPCPGLPPHRRISVFATSCAFNVPATASARPSRSGTRVWSHGRW